MKSANNITIPEMMGVYKGRTSTAVWCRGQPLNKTKEVTDFRIKRGKIQTSVSKLRLNSFTVMEINISATINWS